jgi:hypothetical protein
MHAMEIAFVGFVGVCSLAILVMIGIVLYMTISDVLDRKRKARQ